MVNTFIQNNSANAPDEDDYRSGRFVEHPYSFAASVLVALLEGKELTARDTGHQTRLSQAVELLEDHYGWRIDIRDSVIDIYAGSPARFKTYSLSAKRIVGARWNGADVWRSVVMLAHDLKNQRDCPVGAEILMVLREKLLRKGWA